ncbi:Fis family transcriptional regulator [Paenibacillus swuensis]|uniref:Fis family transcriptional regulator n=1 Tax=Paenibacillus swuensis TaxID=1178515 RepID=A0A172TDQ7_9BACL|nr:sigma 54-interacting transcriptional regulator [Paenibacillus swuensis]ANE45169.1 Fis family transcriptional regulator [Paenibacillus swuensis]
MAQILTLLAGTKETRKTLHAQLEDILGNYVRAESFSLEEQDIPSVIHDRMIILSSHLIEEEVSPFIGQGCHVITADRITNYEHIDKLLQLPKGTRALYVNDFPETVSESITNLLELGIDNIEYIPYFPGKKNLHRVPLAITPGEFELVPEYVTDIINIGPRLIDITTITEIIRFLQLPAAVGREISNRFTGKIIELSKKLALTNAETEQLNDHFKHVLNGVNDGIMALDTRGRITVFNEIMETASRMSSRYAIGRPLVEVIQHPELVKYIVGESDPGGQCFALNQTDFMVEKLHLKTEDSIVVTFKDMHETIKMERTLRRELVKKGFVAKYSFQDIIGDSPLLNKTKDVAAKLAKTDLTVLIEGESGTGKELFASAMHNASFRNQQTFLAINFSALSEDLIESELFGYEEGAFTGAKKGGKTGLFEQANGGTIFLDEIGDISLKLQARLLRVLQEKEIMRIGGSKIIPIDVRVIAATNKDLLQMIDLGKFREDLYHRLKVLYLHLPELRKRKEDISRLIRHFTRVTGRDSVVILPEVLHRLTQYEWFGNIRELKNTLDYMLAVCDGDVVTLDDIPEEHFFQRSAAGNRGELVYRSDGTAVGGSRESDAVVAISDEEELLFILETVYLYNRKGEPVGRQKISEKSSRSSRPLSEQQIRHRVDQLEQDGYLIVSRGRTGIKLTQSGLGKLVASGVPLSAVT